MNKADIGEASPLMATALQHVGSRITETAAARTMTRDVDIDRYQMTVAIKQMHRDSRDRSVFGVMFKIMFRLDLGVAERLGLPCEELQVDRFIAKHERALDVLFNEWDGFRPPFSTDRCELSVDDSRGAPGAYSTFFTATVKENTYRFSVWNITLPWLRWMKGTA